MQAEQLKSVVRSLEFVVVLAIGVVLGAAVPALAESVVAMTSAARGAEEITPVAGSEWAVPPSPRLSGEPY